MSAYLSTYRRMLLDMHIPDWDPSFLTKYDPVVLVSLYERARATGVMLYCNSHVGLTNYPASTGRMHPGLGGRDVVGDLVRELHARDISTCAYYSVLFDNWAVTEHPEWWVSPIPNTEERERGGERPPLPRYGICCPSNEAYVDLTVERITELLGRYDFDCLFYDMTFWAVICGCARCRDRYGEPIPENVDWTSPDWCRFQAAREEWMREFVRRIVATAKSVRPDMPVYNNFALSVTNWVPGFALSLADEVDFLGGDMYGDSTEQLVVSKLMLNLTRQRPAEFMTSLCVNLTDHVKLRSPDDLAMKAFAAAAHSSACLFIDAIDPDGTIDVVRYDLVGKIFDRIAPYEQYFGGEPVEDVAVYHSSESRMSFDEDGTPVGSHSLGEERTPHQRALRGACRMLQRAHVPFGVITRRQLGELDRYEVVVLPNVARMDAEEVDAFREYVRRGGRLYASGTTSLTETSGVRHDDFMLADVFGCSFDGWTEGATIYLKPANDEVASLVAPQRYVSARSGGPSIRATSATPAATLTLAYGHPHPGSVFDRHWASIHSTTPHADTDRPLIVANGACVYTSIDHESSDAAADERLFIGVIGGLLGDRARWSARAHPSVWVTVFDQPEHKRMVASFVNYQTDLPAAPVTDVSIALRGKRFTDVWSADGGVVTGDAGDDGISATLERLDDFAMLIATYE